MASQSTFYSLFICKEDLISCKRPHEVSVTMAMLHGTEACSIVARDNSCLYLWQANGLIKDRHVCFCARYLALSKHCHIFTPQHSQSQHFLSYCGGRHWHVEPAVHFYSQALQKIKSCQWLSKNVCLIEKFSRGSSWWNAASAAEMLWMLCMNNIHNVCHYTA